MPPKECGSTSTKYNYQQVNELERAMKVLRNAGFLEDSLPFKSLYQKRGVILTKIGLKFPRVPSLLHVLMGMSPGVIKVFHDEESGWFTEARAKPGAPPVYHHVTDEVAMALLKQEVTPELERQLLTPDEYVGE